MFRQTLHVHSKTMDDHGAGLFTFDFTDREIHGCCCGKASYFTLDGNSHFPQDLKRLGHTRTREEGWGKEEKKITFRQVTGMKGNNFAVQLPDL
jgi:hypothetical protein